MASDFGPQTRATLGLITAETLSNGHGRQANMLVLTSINSLSEEAQGFAGSGAFVQHLGDARSLVASHEARVAALYTPTPPAPASHATASTQVNFTNKSRGPGFQGPGGVA